MDTTANSIKYDDRPLLTRHAVLRTAGQEIPGRYCEMRRMWVVDTGEGTRPLIEVAGQLAELVTKTRVELERDDTEDVIALALITKTDVQTERDDESRLTSGVLELLTKTEVNTEQDKQDLDGFGTALLEISTKTAIDVEQDRQDVGAWGAALLETQTKTLVVTEQDDTALQLEAWCDPAGAVPSRH
ncbi:MAG: hypothetical protein ACREE0_21870 [Phenylobacterium sp.]